MKCVIHYPCVPPHVNPYNNLLISSLNKIGIPSRPCNSIISLYKDIFFGQVSAVHFHWLDRAGGHFSGTPSKLLWQSSIIFIILVARLLNIRLVWTIHNLEAHNKAIKSYHFYHFVSILVNSLIAHSPYAIKLISATYDVKPNKITFIPHGLYPHAFALSSSSAIPRRQSSLALKLLYFGNISPYKGIDTFALALNHISQFLGDHNPQVSIVGRLNTVRFPDLLQQIKNCDNVSLISEFVDQSELNRFVADADLIVLPFLDTLTSGSLIYALSSAKPVLISDIQSLAFYLSPSYSFTFTPGNVDSLASKLSFICLNHSRETLQSMGQSARAFASTLDWHTIAIKTSKLY
jgi:beta-1,4-mannosyltransferase